MTMYEGASEWPRPDFRGGSLGATISVSDCCEMLLDIEGLREPGTNIGEGLWEPAPNDGDTIKKEVHTAIFGMWADLVLLY